MKPLYELSRLSIYKITKMAYNEFETANFDPDDLNKVLKVLGIKVNTVLETNFIYAIIKNNLPLLIEGTFSVDSMTIPEKKKYEFSFVEHVSQNIDYYYKYDDVELYYPNKSHIDDIVRNDSYSDSDPYWNNSADESDYRDSESYDTSIRNIRQSS